jgi:hypothetical protein
MIKLPKVIAIYPQKKTKPDYLLCWIPADSYHEIATDAEVEAELKKFYPNGIEIELSEAGLGEIGVRLETPLEDLRQAYLELFAEGMLPESGMIEIDILQQYMADKETGRSIEELTRSAEPETLSFGIPESDWLSKIKEGPEMTGGEDSQDLFQQLSVRQVKPPADQRGGE